MPAAVEPMTLVEARLAILRALNASDEWDGPAIELDGEATRILAIDHHDGGSTLWVVSVEPAVITPASTAAMRTAQHITERAPVRPHEDGCALAPDHDGVCRDSDRVDLTIPF